MKDKKYHARQIVKKSLLIVLCLSPFLIPAIIFSPWIFLLTIVVMLAISYLWKHRKLSIPVFFIISFIFGCVGIYSWLNEKPKITFNFDADKLVEVFKKNEVRAEDLYVGKWMFVSGKIDLIGSDIFGDPYVTLKGGDGFMNHVQCVFDKKDRSKIGNMRKGEYLTVAGICSGTIFGGVIVKKCSTFP
jgi:energy-coupling factor transporter transmembrane protein EcfT